MDKNICRLVNRYVKKFDTRNPFEIAERLGIEYQIGDLGSSWGCYIYLKKHRCIFINENLSDDDMIQVMAHELGHALLHRTQNCYFIRNKTFLPESRIEKEANLFAANLLIPDDVLYEAREQEYTINQVARLTKCSDLLVSLRLIDESLV